MMTNVTTCLVCEPDGGKARGEHPARVGRLRIVGGLVRTKHRDLRIQACDRSVDVVAPRASSRFFCTAAICASMDSWRFWIAWLARCLALRQEDVGDRVDHLGRVLWHQYLCRRSAVPGCYSAPRH